ncbi:MAG: amino acid ABC transporter permease [Oscillospiraceae bacterium]|jgi:putative glutamine transport system permease protein|nr:amino acid ABC transporter permease [Oscillospiraceae bacterium]
MADIFTPNNMKFLLVGLRMTLYISAISLILSTIIGCVLGVMRNSKILPLKAVAAVYIEIVRNIPNLLWIFVVFLVLRMKSTQAGITAFTLFTSAAIGEIVRGGLNSIGHGQIEAARSQGFNAWQVLRYIILPQAFRKIIPTLVSQFITVVKDTSFLWSVVAIQELTGKATILMGRYYRVNQVFILYGIVALTYFIINFGLSNVFRHVQKRLGTW